MKIFVLTLVIIILIIFIIKVIIDLLKLEKDHNSSKIKKEN